MPTAAQRRLLFDELAAQSRAVALRLADGRRLGVEQQEETITESFLLELARAQPLVKVRTFTRAQESRETGADWAWWWEGQHQWFGALVQAKRLSVQGAEFGYDFGYRPRRSDSRPDPERQIDLLLRAARDWDLPALFALYNGPDFEMKPSWWRCDEVAFDPSAMGIAVLPAAVAAWLLGLGSTTQDSVNQYSRALPCVLCPHSCMGYPSPVRWLLQTPWLDRDDLGFDDDTPDDDPALRAALSVLVALAEARVGQFRQLDASSPVLASVRRGVRDEPPSYVLAAMASSEPLDAREFDGDVPARVVVVTRANQDG